jgi:hypothetical protein
MVKVSHRLGSAGYVGQYAFGEATKFSGLGVEPLTGIGAAHELGMLKAFASGGVDTGVSTVQGDVDGGNLGGESDGSVCDDDMLLTDMLLDMMCLLSWVASIGPSSVGAAFSGAALGPGGDLNAGTDGDACMKETGSVSCSLLCFGHAPVPLARIDGFIIVRGNGGYSTCDCWGPGDALCSRRSVIDWCCHPRK